MTQVLSYSGKQRAVKRNEKMASLHGGRCDIRLAFIYKPIYCRGGERVGGVGGPEYFSTSCKNKKRGAASATPWLWGIQNTPRTYLPTLIQQSLKEKELNVFEPSEVKHCERQGSRHCCIQIEHWKEEQWGSGRGVGGGQCQISAFIQTSMSFNRRVTV